MSETIQDIYDARVAAGALAPDPAQHALLPKLDAIKAHLEKPVSRKGFLSGFFEQPAAPPRGLYIWGGVGRGKSMLMDLFHGAVDIPDKRRVHFHAFMQEIHAGLHAARKRGVDDAIKPVAEGVARDLRLLSFDEMQITDITDAMIVGRLFQSLFAAGVVIVATSNRVPDDLYKDGLNRDLFLPFIALLKEHMEVHHLQSPTDYRLDRLADSDRYFCPADSAARRQIDALWNDLTGGKSEELVLRVQGRDVVLPAFSNGVARVKFWELCGSPLGPADYLAVAQAVKVLFLEEIPRLSRSNFNEARRFVTLIDALYEARVRLVASAADIPKRLYVEGDGVFEFERTASRLQEMQGADWGA